MRYAESSLCHFIKELRLCDAEECKAGFDAVAGFVSVHLCSFLFFVIKFECIEVQNRTCVDNRVESSYTLCVFGDCAVVRAMSGAVFFCLFIEIIISPFRQKN